MDYIELSLSGVLTQDQSESLSALLTHAGFEGIVEEEGIFRAYVPAHSFDPSQADEFLDLLNIQEFWAVSAVGEQNWNEVWESQFQPVVVAGICRVRAPFHPPDPDYPLELVIMPKMSFGTAHHETTAMMMEWLLEFPPSGKIVLDMGSGTGILAILAARLGACSVDAIDNDEWAHNNAQENIVINDVKDVRVDLGDVSLLYTREPYDLILANINRNILLEDLPVYSRSLRPGGTLLLSGFYEQDLTVIEAKAREWGLRPAGTKSKNRWISARFSTPDKA